MLWCTVRDTLEAGDHLVIFGEVVSYRGAAAPRLLLRYQRRYLASGEPLSDDPPGGYPI